MVTGSRLSYKMPWLSQFFISSGLALIRDCIVRLLCGCTVILEIYTQYVHCYVFAINFKKAVVISQIFLQRAFFCCRGLFLYSGKNNKGKDIQCQNTAKQQFLLKVVGLRDTLLFDGLRGYWMDHETFLSVSLQILQEIFGCTNTYMDSTLEEAISSKGPMR